jgi:carboxymethylenebutenolidase
MVIGLSPVWISIVISGWLRSTPPKMLDDYAGLQAPVLIHVADGDEINPPTLAEELNEKISEGTGRKPEIDHYPAGHAFLNEEDLLGTFDAEQARIAWDRTVAFLRAHQG